MTDGGWKKLQKRRYRTPESQRLLISIDKQEKKRPLSQQQGCSGFVLPEKKVLGSTKTNECWAATENLRRCCCLVGDVVRSAAAVSQLHTTCSPGLDINDYILLGLRSQITF